MKFETERLLLKPASVEDAAFVFELLNTPKWLQYIGDRNVNSIEDAEAYIKNRMLPQFERLGYGNYIVIRKSDNIKIGSCGLYDREGLQGIDIGFAFLPEYEGKGYAYEAATTILDAGVHIFEIKKINAITLPSNFSSQKLLEKLGLKYIELIKIPNDDEELMYYEYYV
jgi:[ribosomal protein S5]-alanine N-acetyltransferase